MLVFIEARHIQGAIRGNSWCCPIARALNEQLGLAHDANSTLFMDHTRAMLTRIIIEDLNDNELWAYEPSLKAREFMAEFDDGNEVKPCTLELYQHPRMLPILRPFFAGSGHAALNLRNVGDE